MAKATKKTAKKASASSTTKKASKKSSEKKAAKSGGRRGLWKGAISFGLVNIPIHLESANQEEKIHFSLLDKKDHGRIGYKQYNKSTGKEIRKQDIVKGYEIEKGEFVIMTDADFDKANVKATRHIDIEDFVDLASVDPIYFEKPYWVVPEKGGEKSYVLLRDVLKSTGRAAVAKIVLHTVQRLVVIFPREDNLVLEIVRFANELKDSHELDALPDEALHAKISDRELKAAEGLVESMTAEWDPEKYRNTYHDDLMKLIKAKKSGRVIPAEAADSDDEDTSNVIDLTALLQKSLSNAGKGATKSRSKQKASS